jgi:branched-chain amino acid transport system ATP-binding protein
MDEWLLLTEGLTKSFGAVKACNDLYLNIAQGEIHALIGPNGAGKTTVLNQLSGNLSPDSGRIVFNGRDITREPLHRRSHLGLTRSYQITSVFENLTVKENFLLAIQAHCGHSFRFWRCADQDPELTGRVLPSIKQMGLEERSHVRAGSLSHGEKRQLEVGMALAGNPKLLLLDEPMAGMGPGGAVELSKLIQKLRKDVTILLVEHDMDAVFKLADRITVLVYGEVVASGTPDRIRSDPTVQHAYLGDKAESC